MHADARELRIGTIFSNAARAVPEHAAVVVEDQVLSYRELDGRSDRFARVLASLGVRRGHRVVTWLDTTMDLFPAFAAVAKAGAVFVPTNPGAPAGDLLEILGAAPHHLLTDARHERDAANLAESLGCGVVGLGEVAERARTEQEGWNDQPPPAERDPHVIFFTSGSTGRPKGAVLSHRVNVLRSHPGSQLEPRGALVCPYPPFHMSVWTLALQQWQARDTFVLVPSADAASICAAVEEHQAARLNCIPGVWRRVLDYMGTPAGAGADLGSLRFADTGTSATPLDLLEAIEAAAPNARLRVFYGSTEAGNVAALDHADIRRKPDSCGTPSPFSEVRIDDGGELVVRGPLLFDGYFEDEDATASALVDGWYHTGDLTTVDEDGFLCIVGRASGLIRTGGESVAPSEVELVPAEHPTVADVAVIGVPDERWGDVVCAAVVVADGRPPPTVDELRRHCEGRLARFKHPRAVVVVDVIPRTPATGQVVRRLLVDVAQALLREGRVPA